MAFQLDGGFQVGVFGLVEQRLGGALGLFDQYGLPSSPSGISVSEKQNCQKEAMSLPNFFPKMSMT